jgi:ribulose-phosphate 3-epimerase
MLPIAATATGGNVHAGDIDTTARRSQDLHDPSLEELPALPGHFGPNPVAGKGSVDEHNAAVGPLCDPCSPRCDSVNLEVGQDFHWTKGGIRVEKRPRCAAMTDLPAGHPPILIAPSVLPADFARLGDECEALELAGVDRIQWDVMDGRFVPNLTFGADVIAACRSVVSVPFEAHLMIEEPDHLIPSFIDSGCEIIIVHVETTTHLHRTLSMIRELGASPAVALNPHTPIESVVNVLDLLDMVLVMTVNPGFGGQTYIASMQPKIDATRKLLDRSDRWIDLEVDGGISASTVEGAAGSGANVLISGSAMFRHPDGKAAAVTELRQLGRKAWEARLSA